MENKSIENWGKHFYHNFPERQETPSRGTAKQGEASLPLGGKVLNTRGPIAYLSPRVAREESLLQWLQRGEQQVSGIKDKK